MAAFPGLTKSRARRNAHYEAIERWSLIEWWEGNLPAERDNFCAGMPSTKIYRIKIPFRKVRMCILVTEYSEGRFAYGFAAGASNQEAVNHANVELSRNVRVLRLHDSASFKSDLALNTIERRLLFFSSMDGFEIFSRRLYDSMTRGMTTTPKLNVDEEIPGPWTRYAHVWRCLYRPNNENWQTKSPNYFLF